jgi:multisubunit Na+/H+ antiporter MnhG subunit
LVLIFFAVGNPTATHAIARAAYKLGLEMWTAKTRGDDLSGRIDYLEPEDHLTEDKR